MSKVKVSWEDQQRINSYGVLTGRKREIEAHLEEIEEFCRTLDDASTEMTLQSEEVCMYKIGDCFVELEQGDAESMLEKEQETAKEKIDALKKEHESLRKQLAELKVLLTNRFGDLITLDK